MESLDQTIPSWISLPMSLIQDENLSWFEKILLSFIANLSQSEGYCYASNDYLAEKLNTSAGYIKNAILSLKKIGLIEVDSYNKSVKTNRKIRLSGVNPLAQISANKESISTNKCRPLAQISANVIKDELKNKNKKEDREGVSTQPAFSENTNSTFSQKWEKENLDNTNSTLQTNSSAQSTAKGGAKKPKRERCPKPRTEEELMAALAKYVPQYGRQLVRAFFDYWTEKNSSGYTRFEKQEFFEIKRRLATWKRMELEKQAKNSFTQPTAEVYIRPKTLNAI